MTSRAKIQTTAYATELPLPLARKAPTDLPFPEGEGSIRPCPSRYDNPFATCWTRPGAIPFRFADGQSTERLVERFAAANWRGAIIGPHGGGKSTLLETLKLALIAAGHSISSITLRNGQRRLPHRLIDHARPGPADNYAGGRRFIVIVDGYEQLSWLERLRLIGECRRRHLGLLITSHAATCLPTLIRLTPSRQLIEQLVRELCDQVSTHIAAEEVAASHACHGSNVREIFFDLYDRYERRRRNRRTSTPISS